MPIRWHSLQSRSLSGREAVRARTPRNKTLHRNHLNPRQRNSLRELCRTGQAKARLNCREQSVLCAKSYQIAGSAWHRTKSPCFSQPVASERCLQCPGLARGPHSLDIQRLILHPNRLRHQQRSSKRANAKSLLRFLLERGHCAD